METAPSRSSGLYLRALRSNNRFQWDVLAFGEAAPEPGRLDLMKEECIELENEAQQATAMLQGKVVQVVWRHRPGEVGIQFTDGTRLFVDHTASGVELSITEGGVE